MPMQRATLWNDIATHAVVHGIESHGTRSLGQKRRRSEAYGTRQVGQKSTAF